MAWWERSLDRLKEGFAASSGRTHDQHPGPPADAAGTSSEAWSDVPPLQRTLADPIQPVAISDQFRDSLATFADPSFLAPLSHHVDPSVGGLSAGLVFPGGRQTHCGPELVLPQHASSRPKPSVQRLASWSAPEEELHTVPLEYLHQSADEQPIAAGAEPEATSVAPATTELPVTAPVSSVTGTAAGRSEQDLGESAGPALGNAFPSLQSSEAAAPPDAPTLGARSTPAPLFSMAEPPGAFASAVGEPVVQRVRYEPRWNQPQQGAAPTPLHPTEYEDARDWPEVPVSRFAVHSQPGADSDDTGFVETPLVVAWGQTLPSSAATSQSVSDHPAVGVTPGPSSAAPPSIGQTVSSAARMAPPIVAVQRRVADGEYTTPRPEVTVQTQQVAEATASRAVHQQPLVVTPGAVARTPVGDAAPRSEVSFERMFAGFGSSQTQTQANPDDNHFSVQREGAEGTPAASGPTVSASAVEVGALAPSSAGASGGAGPAGGEGIGSTGGNLDEMARRLYEPLAARLREELWLDRERAGLMSDV